MTSEHQTTVARDRRRRDIGVRRWRQTAPSTLSPCRQTKRLGWSRRLRPGAVVWAHVPYEESAQYKTRPAVVITHAGRTATLLPLSSTASRFRYPDRFTEITDTFSAGLLRRCAVRHRPVTLGVIDIVSVAGQLTRRDWAAVLSVHAKACNANARAAGPCTETAP